MRCKRPPARICPDAGAGPRHPWLRPAVPHDRRQDRGATGRQGYDADAIREELTKADVEAVIPAKSNRREPIAHDREKYRWRNLVERLFNKLKNWRRIATRYDKTKKSYLGFVNLVSVLQWIPFVHEA
jgi:transposase